MSASARAQAFGVMAAAGGIGATCFVVESHRASGTADLVSTRSPVTSNGAAPFSSAIAAASRMAAATSNAGFSTAVAPFTAAAVAAVAVGALHARRSRHDRHLRQPKRSVSVSMCAAKAKGRPRGKKGGPANKGPKVGRGPLKKKQEEEEPLDIIIIPEEGWTVSELADKIRKPVAQIITYFFAERGIPLTINSVLDRERCMEVCEKYEIEALFDDEEQQSAAADRGILAEEIAEDKASPRAPVVTVMGHVDHGKTTLLDTIRQRSIAATEAGGITQRIGAYTVEVNGEKITFIDTPGHEAFTSMRARGAQVTDIAVLVVAADDGVMPQTREAIAHARAADVPIIVAINKIDVPKAAPDKAREALSQEGLQCEEWGGDVPMVEVSAKKNINLDNLLEIISLTSQVQELKADYAGMAAGVILESTYDDKKGTLATVLVQKGTMKIGDPVIAGTVFGRVRSMQNEAGKEIKECEPSRAVQLAGFDKPPGAGDKFEVCKDIGEARKVVEKRLREQGRASQVGYVGSKDDETAMRIAVILKTDAQGSIAAVKHMFNEVKDSKYINLRWVLTAPGPITDSDVDLAAACPDEQRAMVIGFNSSAMPSAVKLAKQKNVEIRTFKVIYELFETVVAALENELGSEEQLTERGRAQVLQVFGGRDGNVAGCRVEEGQLAVGNVVKVFRGNETVGEGPILSLRRGKSEVQDVDEGNECGFCLTGWDAWEAGDRVVCFEVVTIKPQIVEKRQDFSKKKVAA